MSLVEGLGLAIQLLVFWPYDLQGGIRWRILSGFATWFPFHSALTSFSSGHRAAGKWSPSNGGASCPIPKLLQRADSMKTFLLGCACQTTAGASRSTPGSIRP